MLAGVTFQLDLGQRWFGWDYPSPVDEPAEVAPPPGLTLPDFGVAPAVAGVTEERAASPARVQRAVAKPLRDRRLGKRVAVAVSQLSDGSPVFRTGPPQVTPASTMKMLTAAAALEVLGPDHTFRTSVVAGDTADQIVLVGGGDPLLASAPAEDDVYPARADLRALAVGTAKALQEAGLSRVSLRYDTSLFTGPSVSPDWPKSYVPDDVVSPISSLWADQGRTKPGLSQRERNPAAAAAQVFRKALAAKRIKVVGSPRPGRAPAGATELAVVESAPLEQIVQWVLEVSDNEAAEVLFRHVALAEGQPGSFAGGNTAVSSVLERLGIPMTGARILDGSGLSRENRLRPETLLAVIGVAASPENPDLRAVVTALPVAGFTGSLSFRFETGDDAGLGRVRAKTGTLTGVHGLAGVLTDRDGTELGFVVVADRVKVENTLAARDLIDEVAAALAACSCGASSP